MRIKGIYIDGFGIFNHFSLPQLPEGITIINGPNEAGKSTLLEFIRGILFGFPKLTGKKGVYPPLQGGTYGGNITINFKGKTIIITRQTAANKSFNTISDSNGKLLTEDYLRLNILGGADQKLFRSVFAFSLDELQHFSSLSDDEIGEGIVAAGVSGTGNPVKHALKLLKDQATELLAPQKACLLKNNVKSLKEKRKELIAAQKAFEKYPEMLREEENLYKQFDLIHQRKNNLEQIAHHYQSLKQLWPIWNEIIELEKSLKRNSLNTDTTLFLNESPSMLLEGRLPTDELAEVTDLMIGHDKFTQQYHINSRQLSIDTNQLHSVEIELQNSFIKLGPGWNEDKVLQLDTSLPIESEVHAFEEQLRTATENYKNVHQKHTEISERIEYTQFNYNMIKEELNTLEYQEEALLTKRRTALGQLRALQNDRINSQRDHYLLEKEVSEIRQQIQSLENSQIHNTPKWPVPVTLILSVTAFIAAILLVVKSDINIGILLFFLAFATGISSRLYYQHWKRYRKLEAQFKEDIQREQLKLKTAKQTFVNSEKQISLLNSQIEQIISFLQLPVDLTSGDLEVQIAQADIQLQELKAVNTKLKDLHIEISNLKTQENKLIIALDNAQKYKLYIQSQWSGWIQPKGINQSLTPSDVIDLFKVIESVTQSLHSKRDLLEKIKGIQQEMGEWEEKAKFLLRKTGITIDNSLTGVELSNQFNSVLEKLNQRKERFNILKNYYFQILTNLGKGDAANTLLKELISGEVQQWEQKADEIESKRDTIEKELLQITEKRLQIKKEREELESSSTIVKIESQIDGLHTDISSAIRKWRVISLAKALIEETFNRYVRNRQPGVYEEASEYFKRVTNSRYQKIVYDLEAKEPAVFDSHNHRLKINELSRGTREQLYLCIRLGLATEFAAKGTSLPIVMDDVLVNFDPQRATAMATVLTEYSETRQLLLFTCHPYTVSLFKKVNPQINIIDMPDSINM